MLQTFYTYLNVTNILYFKRALNQRNHWFVLTILLQLRKDSVIKLLFSLKNMSLNSREQNPVNPDKSKESKFNNLTWKFGQ